MSTKDKLKRAAKAADYANAKDAAYAAYATYVAAAKSNVDKAALKRRLNELKPRWH